MSRKVERVYPEPFSTSEPGSIAVDHASGCRDAIAEFGGHVDGLKVLLTVVIVGVVLIGLAASPNEARQQRITAQATLSGRPLVSS